MQIQVNSDHHIASTEKLSELVRTEVEGGLGHLTQHITRVEVHLNDTNGHKGGINDKRCMMEARLKGHEPIAVIETASNLNLAIGGAVKKLHNAVSHVVDRRGDVRAIQVPPEAT